MLKPVVICSLLMTLISSCENDKNSNEPSSDIKSESPKPKTETSASLPELPSFVIYKNWEPGKVQNVQLILDVYKAWDSDNHGNMASYFADSTSYDFPDGTRATTTKETVESKFRQWRNGFKETSNIPFSLISLYNKDRDQEWVIAWTWNKWSYADGKKDSMLFCDNWRIKDGKIQYLNSLQNHPSKSLSNTLNKIVPK